MEAKNIIQETDDFLKEIDGSIDALFVPVRKIEIDTLTNEIKAEEETLPQNGPVDSDGIKKTPPQVLEPGSAKAGIPQNEVEQDSGSPVTQLQQALLSLDWEISERSIGEVEGCLERIGQSAPWSGSEPSLEILANMKTVMRHVHAAPGSIDPLTMQILHKGLEGLTHAASRQDDTGPEWTDRLDAIVRETKELAARAVSATPVSIEDHGKDVGHDDPLDGLVLEIEDTETIPVPDAGPQPVDLSAEQTDQDRENPVNTTSQNADGCGHEPPETTEIANTDTRTGKRHVPEETSIEQPSDETHCAASSGMWAIPANREESPPAPPHSPHPSTHSPSLARHIQKLDSWIERLQPIEELFAKTPGMEKLHRFHRGLRQEMEGERLRIEVLMAGRETTQPDIPAPVMHVPPQPPIPSAGTQENVVEDRAAFPWKSLVSTSLEGEQIAFNPDEVAYSGQLPWWVGGKAPRSGMFPLKLIRPWPWSKIRDQLSGDIALSDEASLKALQLPIWNPPGRPTAASTGKPYIVILSSDKRGLVLVLAGPPEELDLADNWNWIPAPDPDDEHMTGEIRKNGTSITVITAAA